MYDIYENNDYYLLKYIDKSDIKKGMKELISNYKLLNNFVTEYNLILGNLFSIHNKKLLI